MFNKLLIIMVSIFTISSYLLPKNSYEDIANLDESDTKYSYFNEWGLIFNNNLNPTILSSSQSIDPYSSVRLEIIGKDSVFVTNQTFSNNTTLYAGGAMYIRNSANIHLSDVTFSGNTAVSAGGAMYIRDSTNNKSY